MKRKFTFLLMALLALAGFKSWAQRGYTYELVTSFPSTPDPADEYVLGYSDGTNYYFHETGENAGAMTLAAPSANTKVYTFAKEKLYDFLPIVYPVAKCNGKYLYIYSQTVKLTPTMEGSVDIDNGQVTNDNRDYYVYADGSIIKSYAWGDGMPAGGHPLSFYKRTGSAAPTYAVTVTSDTEGCTASADKASYEEGETVTLSYEADAFHYFVEWQCSDVTITDNTFEMPANEVSVTAHFAAKPTHSITATVNPENAGTASVTYQSNTITEAPAGAVLNLSAIANHGFDFVSWTIGDEVVSTSANYNYTMPDNDVAIVANFGEHQFLHVNIDPNIVGGTITVNPSECDPGATVTVTPNAASGYQYVYGHITVTDANEQPVYVYQGNPNSTFEMPNTDVIVSATFTKLYSVSMGTVQNGSAYPAQGSGVAGSTIIVYVTPNTGCEVISVIANYEGGSITASFEDVYNDQYLYYFDMPAADVTVDVVCAQTYTVSYTPPTGGTISVSPTTNVPASQSVSISIDHIQTHYSFDYANYASKISVKDASQEAVIVNKESDGHYYFLMPASNVTVAVTFDEDANYDIAVTQPEGCTIKVYPSENVYANETVYLSYYNVQTGYKFVEWVVKDGEETITPEYDYYGYYFTMPASENVTVTATVEALTAHTVNIAEGIIGGSVSAHTGNDHEAPINAYAGEYVNLTNTPETGYQFVSYTVTSQCETVEVYYNNYFIMPDCDVTVSATFALAPQDLTVNEGTATNQTIPTTTAQTWYSTKSQFIIPYDQLESMFDGTITDLTFYADFNSFDFGDARWNVYVKEVDYQTLNDYVSTEGMTLVYNGGMAITNGQMHIDFDTDFQYSDNNLLIYFEQIQAGSCTDDWRSWYGVTTSKATAYAGYDYGSGQGDNSHYAQWFLPKTTIKYMPSANPQARYDIAINNPEGTTITASKTKAAEGTVITLTQETSNDYTFNSWDVTSELGDVTVDENNQFTMPAANVTVSANLTLKQHYFVTLDEEMTNGELFLYPESEEIGYLPGANISIYVNPDEGYKFDEEYGVKAWKADEPETEVDVTTGYSGYNITMPEYNIVISARFTELTAYTITYHVNGVENPETVYENEGINPSNPVVPAGTSFIGWATNDIATYNTVAPELFETGSGVHPTTNMDLYAVFRYADQSKWTPVYDESSLSTDGSDRVIFAYYLSGNPTIMTYYDSWHFESTVGEMNDNAEIVNIPTNTTIFRPEKTNGTWKFYFDYNGSETTLADYGGNNLYPLSYYSDGSETDTWNIYFGFVYDNNDYIGLRNNNTFSIHDSNQARLYKEVMPENGLDAYFTEVLSVSGNESMNEDKEVRNLLINEGASYTVNGAKLTVSGFTKNVENKAANFVVTDGGQLEHYTDGTVATFEKNIIDYNAPEAIGDGWYFIANPTANTTVNLSGGNSYDLYTFNPAAAAEWHNEQYIDEVLIPEENIAISRETGYLYANAANFTLKFEGELIPSGEDQTIDLVYYNGVEPGREFPGFNLIGNPFSCTAYISGDFDMYKLVNGSDVEISEDYTVAPCEAFFVEATEVGETVTLSTTAPTEKSYAMPIVVNSDRGETLDRAILHLEGTRNSHKFMMNPDRTNISFAKNGERFASVSRGDETEIPMNFTADHKGSYTISFNTENFEEGYLHLIDVVSGDNIDLLVTPSYTFEADADEYASRFRIVFGTTDINDNPATSSAPFVYISNGNLVINNVEGTASMQIVDMLGRIVRTETVSGSYNRPHNLKAGAYVITLDGRAQRIVIE